MSKALSTSQFLSISSTSRVHPISTERSPSPQPALLSISSTSRTQHRSTERLLSISSTSTSNQPRTAPLYAAPNAAPNAAQNAAPNGAGAGIQADIKACEAAGVYCSSVVTTVTAQNTVGVQGVHPVPEDFVAEQLRSVLSDMEVDV